MTLRLRRIVWRTTLALGLLIVAGAMTAKFAGFGCASRSDWSAPAVSSASQADRLEGLWSGTWASSQRDMGGDLHCRISKLPNNLYQAQFDAVFGRVFNHRSTVTLSVSQQPTRWEFTGQKDLGLLGGGIYKYAGWSDGQTFQCTYDSAYDKGTFRLTRAVPTTRPNR